MKESFIPKVLPPLRLPQDFEQELSEPLEILAASLLAGHMLWPEVKDERSRSLYLTLALRKIHDVLLEGDREQAQTAFTYILETYLGGWPQYTQNLVLAHFPERGKGSLAERAWEGRLAGSVFHRAFHDKISLNAAAKKVSAETISDLQAGEFSDVPKPAAGNIMKNYWTPFRSVAHFWAATDLFVIPPPTDGIIRFDKAEPTPALAGKARSGWRGIMKVAHCFLEQSAHVKRYKTHRPLLDPEIAFRVIFTE